MSGGFVDHFSATASSYGVFRPRYPQSLFEHLAARASPRDLAWDCATGSGQALRGLAGHFRQVVASDASLAQLGEARRHGHGRLFGARAERAPLAAARVDLVTVAQALHWFDLPGFFAEVERVLKPGGLLAAWTYNLFSVSPAVDAVVAEFYHAGIGRWWPPDRRQVETAYAEIALPWGGGTRETFTMTHAWSCAHLAAYVGTWSAVTRCRHATGHDPMPAFAARLAAAWGDAPRRRVSWPVTLKTTRKPAPC